MGKEVLCLLEPLIPSIRRGPQRMEVGTKLGFLAELTGTWGRGGATLVGTPFIGTADPTQGGNGITPLELRRALGPDLSVADPAARKPVPLRAR